MPSRAVRISDKETGLYVNSIKGDKSASENNKEWQSIEACTIISYLAENTEALRRCIPKIIMQSIHMKLYTLQSCES